VEISGPSAQGKWEVPNYVEAPELDEAGDAERLSLADELMGDWPRPHTPGEE
jgi:hypothetical protein